MIYIIMKSIIKIFLQGGGTKCAYQVSFLNNILKNENFLKKYDIGEIYGTSFGAIVGYFLCIKQLDVLHDFFLNLDERSLKPWFDLWGSRDYLVKIPLIGKIIGKITDIIWIIISINKKGFFNQDQSIKNLLDLK